MSENEIATPKTDDSTKAKVIEGLRKIIASVRNGDDLVSSLAAAKAKLRDLEQQLAPTQSQTSGNSGKATFTPYDLMQDYWNAMGKKGNQAATGFAGLDKALSGGLEQDRLVVLLGAPGSGKTTFANQVATFAADAGRAVFYVTSEDVPMTLLSKTIARIGQIDYSAVQYGWSSHKAQINNAFQDYATLPSARLVRYLDATGGTTLDTIAEQAQAHFDAHKAQTTGSPIIVVDYLQRLARGENLGRDLRDSITHYCMQLRAMAVDLHATIILLSSMNRASNYSNTSSVIAAAKESGDIDYTADVIMAIGEDTAQKDAIMPTGHRRWLLRLDKNRQGTTTVEGEHIALDWYGARQQFTEFKPSQEDANDAAIEKAFGVRAGKRGKN